MRPRLNFLSFLTPDQSIISGLLEGGAARRKAEDLLFNHYSYFIQEGCKKYPIDEDDAFDAYSDTMLSVISAVVAGKFEQRSSLKTYVYRVFNNKCVDVIRKSTTNKQSVNKTFALPELLDNLSDTAKSIIQKMIELADTEEMREKLEQLGESCRSLLLLFAEGFTDREIAVTLNYNSADVVKTSRLRCLQKLRMAYSLVKKT